MSSITSAHESDTGSDLVDGSLTEGAEEGGSKASTVVRFGISIMT